MVARYYQEQLNFCWRGLRSRETALDLVQERYARVLGVQARSGPGEQAVREPRAAVPHGAQADDRQSPPRRPFLRSLLPYAAAAMLALCMGAGGHQW